MLKIFFKFNKEWGCKKFCVNGNSQERHGALK
jgi:hypothetical protein